MKYTKEQLAQMSDHEINLAVAKKYYCEKWHTIIESYGSFNWVLKWFRKECLKVFVSNVDVGGLCTSFNEFNPCSNWNDVMPIAEKYHYEIVAGIKVTENLSVTHPWEENRHKAKESRCGNTKRAICEVFLMMESNQ